MNQPLDLVPEPPVLPEPLRPLWQAIVEEANSISAGYGIGDLMAAVTRYTSAAVRNTTPERTTEAMATPQQAPEPEPLPRPSAIDQGTEPR